jgi:hypothetical protein
MPEPISFQLPCQAKYLWRTARCAFVSAYDMFTEQFWVLPAIFPGTPLF